MRLSVCVCLPSPKQQWILTGFCRCNMSSIPGASSSKMAASMTAMQKTVADKKLNSRILTQFFFYNICPTPRTSSSTFFSKMAANMAAMQKNVAAKKLNSRILTQFFFYNICPTPRTSSSNLFFKMAANMAAMQKIVDDKK